MKAIPEAYLAPCSTPGKVVSLPYGKKFILIPAEMRGRICSKVCDSTLIGMMKAVNGIIDIKHYGSDHADFPVSFLRKQVPQT